MRTQRQAHGDTSTRIDLSAKAQFTLIKTPGVSWSIWISAPTGPGLGSTISAEREALVPRSSLGFFSNINLVFVCVENIFLATYGCSCLCLIKFWAWSELYFPLKGATSCSSVKAEVKYHKLIANMPRTFCCCLKNKSHHPWPLLSFGFLGFFVLFCFLERTFIFAQLWA